MRADQVEVLWDGNKSKWVVRIVAGDEVIRRPCDMKKDADDSALRAVAEKTLKDEGYEAGAQISVKR